jgi:hypothetical protein
MPSWKHVLGLPSRIALLFGLGTLSLAGAKADAAGDAGSGGDAARVPHQSALGDLLIWCEAGRIYVSEAGKAAEELPLGNTAEAELLKQLLGQGGATAAKPRVLRDGFMLAGAGGAGFSWRAQRQPVDPTPTPVPTSGASGGGDAGKSITTTTGASGSAAGPVASKK